MPPRTITSKVAYRSLLAATMTLLSGLGAHGATCVTKPGSATGITRGFAEYESFLIIRQVTGNWPFRQDRISEPVYKCKNDGGLWTCSASARVCKS
ncbi:MAG: hypothetical protein J0H65_00445 [Rhizobiales bacterium]|nr:hypothetical protein [Hyphomicrobiales bacterium]